MDISETLVLIGFVGACFLAAATGAAFPPGDWYERLVKPAWRPPNWLRPGLDRSLPDYCRFRLARVAEVRLSRCCTAARDLSRAIGAECRLDADLLRAAPSGLGDH